MNASAGDPETEAILQASRFWVQRVLVPITIMIGVAGNTITVMVLTRKRMRSSTNVYLSALAIADIIYLFFVFLLSFKHYSNIHDGKYVLYWRFLGMTYWFCDAASSTSIWLTVSFTVERYIAVCHPIKGKVFCTERRAKSIIVIVYMFCILTTASTAFEKQLNLINETCIQGCETDSKQLPLRHSSSANGTVHPHHHMSNHLPSGAMDDNYFSQLKKIILSNCTLQPCIIYVPHFPSPLNISRIKNVKSTVIENALEIESANMTSQLQEINLEPVLEKPPSQDEMVTNSSELDENKTNRSCCTQPKIRIEEESTKLGMNNTYTTIIYWYSALFFWLIPLTLIATFNSFLVRAVYLSQKLRRQMTNSQESVGLTHEKRITIMLIGVVVLFMICQTPTGSFLIYNNFYKSKNAREENINLRNFFNYLSILNASCNFLLYCFFSKKFRSTCRELFFARKKPKQDIIMLSSTKSKNSQKFNPYTQGVMRRNASEYHTPRNLETQSLTSSVPRTKSLIIRPIGKARSSDIIT
ncbi:hypothetical protein NQ315_004203 [Exocentrus adspersus]|uniref:G-protein coupled receptors family 1 profile domain-containing protein n=1 Tax=Exocentrus adspersus TaxID=1586481 RepID=A0AAV8W896_9CUCU|nr:hypothetical protein NQ315_004203 [Exocentrus adspersus]